MPELNSNLYQPKPIPVLSENDIVRFWSKVDKTPGHGPQGECWLWTGLLHPMGYGRFCKGNTTYVASRISYFMEHNIDLGELLACHTCDMPACVRSLHLFSGDRLTNAQDAKKKGRTKSEKRRGPRKALRILDPGKVLEMRRRYSNGEDPPALAKSFGVSEGCVYYIVIGRTYRELGSIPVRRRHHWLTSSEVAEIKTRYENGEKQHQLARVFSIRQSTVSKIVTGVRHANSATRKSVGNPAREEN